MINRTETDADELRPVAASSSWQASWPGTRNQFVAGAAFDASRVHFTQGSQFGYLNPDRSVTGVGAFGDGGSTGGNVDGEPFDTRVDLDGRTRTWSLFATDTLALEPRTHLTLSGRYNRTTVDNRDAHHSRRRPGLARRRHTSTAASTPRSA